MISLRLPSPAAITRRCADLEAAPFSYPEVGATRTSPPPGYNVDRYAVPIGRGVDAFDRGRAAIRDWVPFELPWIRVYPQGALREGVLVVVVVKVLGVWWTNVSRVIYVIDEERRFGFAYGTLSAHAETGEELFLVERTPATNDERSRGTVDGDSVEFRIVAFSKPRHFLARLGYPLSRRTQRRFGAGSLEAMRGRVDAERPIPRGKGEA